MRQIFTLFFCIISTISFAQNALVVKPVNAVSNPLVDSLVQKIVGKGVKITNIRSNLKQSTRALATFKTTSPQLLSGIRSGLMMVTGVADTMDGSNNGAVISRAIPASDTVAGSSKGRQMLNRVLASNSTASRRATDCATIQFDFIPATDTIRFNYVFASEEYNTFVCSNFNDIFGFFIKGPGIVGDQNLAPVFPGTKNIALIPGTNLPVSINTVNNGEPGSGPASDCDFTPQGIAAYIDNTTAGQTIPFIFNNIRFNGLTRRLQAVVQVIPCQTYTLTLTVSDVTDGLYDSGVFIEAGSFESSGVTVVQSTVYNDRFPFAIVDCNPGRFLFERCSNDTANRLVIPYIIDPLKSTAFNGKHVKQVDTLGNIVNLSNAFVLRKGRAIDTMVVVGFDSAGISWPDTLPKKLFIRLLDSKTPYIGGNLTQPNYTGDTAVLLIRRKFTYRASKDVEYCQGKDKQLLPVQTENPSIYHYQWKELNRNGDTLASGSLSCDTCFNPVSMSDSTTRYIIYVKDNFTKCLSFDTVHVRIDSLPEIGISTNKEADGNVVCPGDIQRLKLKANPARPNAGWTYEWSAIKSDSLWFAENITLINAKRDSLTIPSLDSNITFILRAFNRGCPSADTVETFIPKKPNFSLIVPSEICLGDSIVIRPQFKENFIRPIYAWEIDCAKWTYVDATKETVQFKPINEGPCKFILAVRGCDGSPLLETEKTTEILAKNCGFFIPSLVITGGLSESNRGFFIFENTAFDNIDGRRKMNGGQLRIYNRWGKMVYDSPYYLNELTYEKLREKYQDGIYYYEYNNTIRNFKQNGYFNIQR